MQSRHGPQRRAPSRDNPEDCVASLEWHATCDLLVPVPGTADDSQPTSRRLSMQWSQPAFEDLRFGFEITMYIASR